MSWVAPADADSGLDAALRLRPELAERYRAFYASLWESGVVSRRILELCHLRVAAVHGCESEWQIRDSAVPLGARELEALRTGDVTVFAAAEQAALGLAEQLPHAHHQMSDAQVAAAKDALGDAGCVALLTALALFDAGCRWRLVLDVPARAVQLESPPLDDGTLI